MTSYKDITNFGVVPALTPAGATTDYTTQVQTAVATTRGVLVIPGWVKVTQQIIVPIGCVLHVPGGSQTGGFVIDTDFNMMNSSVLYAPAGVGWEIGSFGLFFLQPTAAASGDRADLIQYPRAIGFAASATRPKLGPLYIANAWDGIIADGNQGGMNTKLIEIGAFNRGVFIDGAKDFVTIGKIHAWQFGADANPNLMTLHNDGNAVALEVKDCDGFGIDDLMVHNAKVIVNNQTAADPGGSGSFIPHQFGRVTMDGGFGRFYWQRGWGQMNNYSGQDLFEVSGGFLNMVGPKFIGLATPIVSVTGGELFVSGMEMHLRALSNIGCQVSGTGVMIIHGCKIRGRAGVRTAPVFKQVGADAVIRITDVAAYGLSAAHPIIEIDTDRAEHWVDMSGAKYYNVTLPSSRPLGTYILPRVDTVFARTTSPHTLTSVTTAQKLFGPDVSANGAVTLTAGLWRLYVCTTITNMSTVSGNATLSIAAGTATLNGFRIVTRGADGATGAPVAGSFGTTTGSLSTDTLNAVTAGTAAAMLVEMEGWISVSATGTVIPQISLRTAAAAVVSTNTIFYAERIGDGATNTMGAWS